MALEFGVAILWPTLEPITPGWLQSLHLPRHSTPSALPLLQTRGLPQAHL